MRRILFFLLVTFWASSICLGADGPFGLEKGMSLEAITDVIGEIPEPFVSSGFLLQAYLYKVSTLPKVLPEFSSFLLRISPIAGLSEIYIYTRPLGSKDPNPITQYKKLSNMITKKYLHVDTEVGPIEEEITSTWVSKKDGIEGITLYWEILFNPEHIMRIHYQFDNWDLAQRDIDQVERNKDENVF